MNLKAVRYALAFIYIYFGLLKVVGASPATPLAEALVANTVGIEYFGLLFVLLGIVEVGIGVLFLLPRFTREALVLFWIHMAIVTLPLLILPTVAFSAPLVPTLEGQYIIKNVALIALALQLYYYGKRSGTRAARA